MKKATIEQADILARLTRSYAHSTARNTAILAVKNGSASASQHAEVLACLERIAMNGYGTEKTIAKKALFGDLKAI